VALVPRQETEIVLYTQGLSRSERRRIENSVREVDLNEALHARRYFFGQGFQEHGAAQVGVAAHHQFSELVLGSFGPGQVGIRRHLPAHKRPPFGQGGISTKTSVTRLSSARFEAKSGTNQGDFEPVGALLLPFSIHRLRVEAPGSILATRQERDIEQEVHNGPLTLKRYAFPSLGDIRRSEV
jgi:hypothetical protein